MEVEAVPILRVADADAAVRWYERLGFTKQCRASGLLHEHVWLWSWPRARTVDGSSLACPGRFRPDGALGGRPGSAQWREAADDVRTVYRPGAAGDCAGATRSQDAQPQLHRHRAHPAGPPP